MIKSIWRVLIIFFTTTSISAISLKTLEKECLGGHLASCVKAEAIKSGIEPKSEVIVGSKTTKSEKIYSYKLDCDAKVWTGCHNLGVMYGEESDYSKAKFYYKKGCDQGKFKESCYNLGVLYNKINKKSKATKYFKIGCDLNHYVSCYSYGQELFDAKKKSEARLAFDKACKGKVKQACNISRK